jgi:hypothetical protein
VNAAWLRLPSRPLLRGRPPFLPDQLPAARLRELERAAHGGWAHRRAEQLTGR